MPYDMGITDKKAERAVSICGFAAGLILGFVLVMGGGNINSISKIKNVMQKITSVTGGTTESNSTGEASQEQQPGSESTGEKSGDELERLVSDYYYQVLLCYYNGTSGRNFKIDDENFRQDMGSIHDDLVSTTMEIFDGVTKQDPTYTREIFLEGTKRAIEDVKSKSAAITKSFVGYEQGYNLGIGKEFSTWLLDRVEKVKQGK